MAESPDPVSQRAANAEARRLAELARSAGLGDAPDAALEWDRQAIQLLSSAEETPLLADVLRWQGSVLMNRGQTADAEPLYRRSLELSESLGYDGGRAHGLNCLALVSQRRGDLPTAIALYNDAAAMAERCDDQRLLGMIQQNLGILADMRGERTRARVHYWWSLHLFEATNDAEGMTWVLNNLGLVDVADGKFDLAEREYDRSLALARERGDLLAEGVVEENRADLRIQRGELNDALRSISRALAIAEQRGDAARRAAALKLRAICERRREDVSMAIDTLRLAAKFGARADDAMLRAEILFALGEALAASSDVRGARDVWSRALDVFERVGAKAWITRVRARLGVADSDEPS